MTTEPISPVKTENSTTPETPSQTASIPANPSVLPASTNEISTNTKPAARGGETVSVPPRGIPHAVFSDEPLNPDTVIKTEKLYIFTDPKHDRDRLIAQSHLFGNYLTIHAKRFLRVEPKSILDFGCGDGQLSLVLKRIYPKAKVVGIDSDLRAIETAKKLFGRAAGISDTIEYAVGDENNLPEGPFDLIYVSMVLLHSKDPKKLVVNLTQKLAPTGILWIKDGDAQSIANAVDDPDWKYLAEKLMQAMRTIGANAGIVSTLPSILTELGFTNIRTESEVYRLGDPTANSQIALSIFLSAFMNAIPLISKILQIPIEDLRARINQLSQNALKLKGSPRFINVIAQRPETISVTNTTSDSTST